MPATPPDLSRIPLVHATRPSVPMVSFRANGIGRYPNLGQYVIIHAAARRRVNGSTYIIAIYGAYNAMGLIGSECNGIVVLNHTKRHVIADEIGRQPSGYYGASKEQAALFAMLVSLPSKDLIQYLNRSHRFRGTGTL